MGAYIPLLYGAQVEIIHLLAGQKCQNRLWFTFDNPPFTSTDMDSLAEGVAHWWTSDILPYLSFELLTEKTEARDWSGASPSLPVVWLVNVSGGSASPSHSANVAVVVPFRNPIGVNHKLNKHYVPGVPLDGINFNAVDPTFAANLREGYGRLIDKARLFPPVLNWRWVTASAYLDGAPRSDMLWYTCNGPARANRYTVGQRRRRLPP